ncbi:N-methyltryptophan oxidase [Halogeometricum borinquense DSM 11551]|uniref:Glycine/D-amino acid oxidase, deaminating n=1 Tax=Halogeometricum borinquense (strain ATCC 700274 / DSM 11551 / JCM 10706 / KCTC 4070 / PR3) TaxID=469382 RepID=E4NKY6_HALBP|nr:N-methyl-L-tryptophan oxidase [Halogeometricum borinquense]ADQ67138.1 glycine/D-amino acid oxidase, deaminating [Halogeometricum borinquense DSM 11551]ELY29686.1 N-methyltryptophan oxidase [Halogeometricum borinquense DSM 11551]
MRNRYDVIVVGVGGMGSATAYHLANRGADVLGLERYDVPHDMGSSHGVTRIIRKAQYEHPSYVPLVRRAYDLWRELAEKTGRDLLTITGGIDAGPPDSQVFDGSRRSCEAHDIDHELLSAAEVNDRFPGYDLPEDHRAVYQPDGGFLVPEQCIIAHTEAAQAAGGEIRAREPMRDFTPLADGGVRVTTPKGTYEADRLVVTAGAWTPKLVPELEGLAVPERQVLAWLQPSDSAAFDAENFPVFVHADEDGHYYGFPRHDVPGFKFGKFNHFEETVDPDEMDRQPRPADERALRAYAERCFPKGAGPTVKLATCLFTNTPDEHFILDTHPEHPQITIGAGFSGHGFKFASVVGEILADFALDGETNHDTDLFRIDRF